MVVSRPTQMWCALRPGDVEGPTHPVKRMIHAEPCQQPSPPGITVDAADYMANREAPLVAMRGSGADDLRLNAAGSE